MLKKFLYSLRSRTYFTRALAPLHPWVLVLLVSALLQIPGAELFGSAFARPPRDDVVVDLLIVSCHDGDTCRAKNTEGLTLVLRLVGIDAPEITFRKKPGQNYGHEAKISLESRVKNRRVKVKILGNDPYQRQLALILDPALKNTSGSVNEYLVAAGFAFAYSGKGQRADVRNWAQAAQARAQREKKGLWGLPGTQRPADPADFRKAKKNR